MIRGTRFGRLTADRFSGCIGPRLAWLFRCDCGGTKIARIDHVRGGRTASCGCLHRERLLAAVRLSNLKHDMTNTPEFKVWRSMIDRCRNPKDQNWSNYGGRGIKVCKRWMSFVNFYFDMGPRPSADLSIDRKNNDKGYCKRNCRWATAKQQASNRRSAWVTRRLNEKRRIRAAEGTSSG